MIIAERTKVSVALEVGVDPVHVRESIQTEMCAEATACTVSSIMAPQVTSETHANAPKHSIEIFIVR